MEGVRRKKARKSTGSDLKSDPIFESSVSLAPPSPPLPHTKGGKYSRCAAVLELPQNSQSKDQARIHQEFTTFCASVLTPLPPSGAFKTHFALWYPRNVIFKDMAASKHHRATDGSWSGDSATSVRTAAKEIRTLLKSGGTEKKEYLLEVPLCVIVGGLVRSAEGKEFDFVWHYAVLMVKVGEDEEGLKSLEFYQKDSRPLEHCRVLQNVRDLAKELKVERVTLIPGSREETALVPLLASYRVVGKLLDSGRVSQSLSRTYNLVKRNFE